MHMRTRNRISGHTRTRTRTRTHSRILENDYFQSLFEMTTYHQIVDEIYTRVNHVEPWCARVCVYVCGVCSCAWSCSHTHPPRQSLTSHSPNQPSIRSAGTGRLPSTAFCLLTKLLTIRLTTKVQHKHSSLSPQVLGYCPFNHLMTSKGFEIKRHTANSHLHTRVHTHEHIPLHPLPSR